jgi:hypothetical protein
MNLREHLRDILPGLLPKQPAEAIKGTELIRLVRLRLGDEYSDATLRYHFSILSYDPSSPIAKVDQGQGYYLRQASTANSSSAVRVSLFDTGPQGDQRRQRYLRVRAMVERLQLLRAQFPFVLQGRGDSTDTVNAWEVPDLVCADWEVEAGPDDQPRFDEGILSLRRHLGAPEVGITGVTIKLGLELESFPAEFFQALSATRWTTAGELIIAEAVNDEALVETLRALGQQFGVGITTLGLDLGALDEWPDAETILGMTAAEFEVMQSKLRVHRITAAAPRANLDWGLLSTLRKKHTSVAECVQWLADCLDKRMPLP